MSVLSSKGTVRFVITPLALAVVFLGGGSTVWAQAAPGEFINPLTGGLPSNSGPATPPPQTVPSDPSAASGDPADAGAPTLTITIDTSDPSAASDDPNLGGLWQQIDQGRLDLRAKLLAAKGSSQDLYRLWLAREAARESWKQTGLQAEADLFNQYQAQIEANQRASWDEAKAFYANSAAQIKDYAANHPEAADRCQQRLGEVQAWADQDYQLSNSAFGLKNDKYVGFPQITRDGTLSDEELQNFMDPNIPSESIR